MQRLPAAWLMVLATVLFACMGVCVKLASAHFTTATVVICRGAVGAVVIALIAHAQRVPLRTSVPAMHVKRGVAGVLALALWFYAIGRLPLATAVTLNYMSSVWMAVFLLIGAAIGRGRRVDGRLVLAVLVGFAGVALVLRPTIDRDQWLAGLLGLVSGMLAAMAYLQVTALGRAGEPEARVVFYFSLMGTLGGALAWLAMGGGGAEDWAQVPMQGWFELLGVGVFATLAQLLMTRAYATGSTLVNANLQYLGIVHAFLFGVLLFDDPVTLSALLGMGLIVASGMVSARLRPAARAEAATESAGGSR